MATSKYLDFYKKRHETGYGRTGHKHVKIVVDAIRGYGVRTVLDWGAGSRTLADTLKGYRPDFHVTCYDPAVPGLDELPDCQFDAVISTDVLEHIPYEELDTAITQILGFTRIVGYHHIANYPARESMPDGTNLHVVQEFAPWWRAKFEQNGANVVSAVDLPQHAQDGRLLYRYVGITYVKEP